MGLTNRLSQTYYFIVNTNEEVKPEEMALTEKEKEGGFSVLRVNLNDVSELLTQHTTNNPRYVFFY